MGLASGSRLRVLMTFLYGTNFCWAAIILGINSYFLALLADRNRHTPTGMKAVEGIAAIVVIYTIFAAILTCCLGGIIFFTLLALILDLVFVCTMIAIAVLVKRGSSDRCSSLNASDDRASGFGDGYHTYSASPEKICRLKTAALAVALIASFIFFVTALLQAILARRHQKEHRFGPSPANNYTSGPGTRKFWQRREKVDAELGGVSAGSLTAPQPDTRPSNETGYTATIGATPAVPSYEQVEVTQASQMPDGTRSGYYAQPEGATVNPYGYDNQPTHTSGTATTH